ncbi:PREDICTED: uncharacterized protein LOC108381980 isoform X2 [Rhagoletis zephyria]|uniref:uncharacterized protein LOC108381980 isoform X2 n=1 Tax=Rhagoletis zephyria TaxID=28612 RepID=UPI000811950B|nr:PREDICTED: uncharacterized protein LOC108381980 isoform X2 [Rhagoletis zephyria]
MQNLGKPEEQVVNSRLEQVARPLELADALKSVLGQSMEEVQTANQNDGLFAPQSQEQKSAKKRASADKHCSSSSVNDVIAASKFNRDVILEYLNQRMQMAVMNVHEECESPSFKNIEAWLEQFKKWNLPQSCLYEPALVMNGIANNEDIPPANQLEGIDLRSVYKFLGNALMGLPQPKLNTKTAEFLAKEFEVNSNFFLKGKLISCKSCSSLLLQV